MKILPLVLLFTLMTQSLSFAEPPPYTNECEVDKYSYYCKYVGKGVYLKVDKSKRILGTVTAIAWLNKGDLYTTNPPLKAPEDAFYYVVEPKERGPLFLVSTNKAKAVK